MAMSARRFFELSHFRTRTARTMRRSSAAGRYRVLACGDRDARAVFRCMTRYSIYGR